jgi:hypothetical protein
VIILQSRLSGMFFKAFGVWVANAAEALHFQSTNAAREFISLERLADVRVREAERDIYFTDSATAPVM